MRGEAFKLHLIEEILKINNDAVLAEIKSIIAKSWSQSVGRKSFKDFAGMMTEDEVNELDKTIEGDCEMINLDDWK